MPELTIAVKSFMDQHELFEEFFTFGIDRFDCLGRQSLFSGKRAELLHNLGCLMQRRIALVRRAGVEGCLDRSAMFSQMVDSLCQVCWTSGFGYDDGFLDNLITRASAGKGYTQGEPPQHRSIWSHVYSRLKKGDSSQRL